MKYAIFIMTLFILFIVSAAIAGGISPYTEVRYCGEQHAKN